jgi:WD40 repeat protein
MKRWVYLPLILTAMLAGWSALLPGRETAQPEPICPALQTRGSTFDLVVVGTPRPAANDPSRAEVVVDRVLFGCWTGGNVRFRYRGAIESKPGIYALKNMDYRRRWNAGGTLILVDPLEEAGIKALAKAQRDFQLLAAQHIVAGREIERDGWSRTIEVIRTLKGPAIKPGTRLSVQIESRRFLEDIVPEGQVPDGLFFFRNVIKPAKPDEKSSRLDVSFTQPLNAEPAIKSALQHGLDYPLVRQTERSKGEPKREVLFQGPIEETVGLLASTFDSVRMLGGRRLRYEQSRAPTLLPQLIEQDLGRAELNQPRQFTSFRRLIGLLGEIQKEQKRDDLLTKLIDAQLSKLEKGEGPARQSPRVLIQGREVIGEEEQHDVNHGLAWLVAELPDARARRDLIERLRRLQARSSGATRREARLALDLTAVEEEEEIDRGLRRLEKVQPRRSVPRLAACGVPAIAFSRDGRMLAVASGPRVQVLRVGVWAVEADWTAPGPVQQLCFSPGDRSLYLCGPRWRPCRRDWKTGKEERSYAALEKATESTPREGALTLDLSADGKRLAIGGRDTLAVGDTETGACLETREMAFPPSGLLHPDGQSLICLERITRNPAGTEENRETGFAARLLSVAKPHKVLRELPVGDAWQFSPSGRWLIVLQRPPPDADPQTEPVLRVHDGADNFRELSRFEGSDLGSWLAISADSKRLVTVNRQREQATGGVPLLRFQLFSLPKLRPLRSWTWPVARSPELWSLQLSPDGSLLAFALREEMSRLYLFDTRTGQEVLPGEGHPARIVDVGFLPGGQGLRTRDLDGFLCTWDERLNLLGRISLPTGFEVLHARPADGKVLLGRFAEGDSDADQLGVIDAGTGGRVCVFPNHPIEPTKAFWLNDTQMVLGDPSFFLHVDWRRGRVLKEVQSQHPVPDDGIGTPRWTEAGPVLQWLERDRGGPIHGKVLDLNTGKVSQTGELQTLFQGWRRDTGSVGTEHVVLFGPDLHVLDRRQVRLLAERRFSLTNLDGGRLSADGKRFAVLMPKNNALRPAWPENMIGIGDTHTARLQGVVPALRVVEFFLSPDGRRLVLVKDDNSLELWDLANLDRS